MSRREQQLSVPTSPQARERLELVRASLAERTGVRTSLTRVAVAALERGLDAMAHDLGANAADATKERAA